MMMRRGLGLGAERPHLGLQAVAVAQHLGEVGERLGEITAGLRLDGDDDGEEVHLLERHALIHALEGARQRHADLLLLDEVDELAPHGLRRFPGDDLHAVGERQTRLDAAHDDVDGVGKLDQEFGLTALDHARKYPARQTEPAGEGDEQRHQRRGAGDEDDESSHHAGRQAQEIIGARLHAEAGADQSRAERHPLLRLLLGLDVLDGVLHLLLAHLQGLRQGAAPLRLGLALRHIGDALLRLALAAHVRHHQHIDDPADGEAGQRHGCQLHELRTEQSALLADAPARRALRPRLESRSGAFPRRNSAPSPRNAAGRCRSSDAARKCGRWRPRRRFRR